MRTIGDIPPNETEQKNRPKTTVEVAGDILNTASSLVSNTKGKDHGDVEPSFQMIADMWSTYLSHSMMSAGISPKGGIFVKITPYDVAYMMADLKKARALYGDSVLNDHYVDGAAYTAIAGGILMKGKSS